MDLKTKVEKIKMLHEHHGRGKHAESFAKLITAMRKFSDCRNIVAHRKCVGKSRSEPSRLAFLSAKHIKKVPGQFEIMYVDHSELITSAEFARDSAVKVHEMIIAIEDSRKRRSGG
jgi:hypothetical protein